MQIDPRLQAIGNSLYRLSVKALVIHDGKLLLVKEKDDEWLSFPGGGVDWGETLLEALRRELSEELGVSKEAIKTDGRIVHAVVGPVVDNIPKANIFYRVEIPITAIKPTAHVLKFEWLTPRELHNHYLSPSTGEAADLATLTKRLIEVN